MGFTNLTEFESNVTSEYYPKKGDIAVYENPSNSNEPGHICMYNGQNWYSDFKQRNMFVYSDGTSNIKIFRMEQQ